MEMPNPFKVGDIVECINDFGDKGPIQGKQYKVKSVAFKWIGIELPGISNLYYPEAVRSGLEPNWGMHCFKLVDEPALPDWF